MKRNYRKKSHTCASRNQFAAQQTTATQHQAEAEVPQAPSKQWLKLMEVVVVQW
jgi:hypothetical protein